MHPSHRIYDFGEIAVYTAVAGGDAIRLSDRRKEVLFSDAGAIAFASGPANFDLPTRFLQLVIADGMEEWIPLVVAGYAGTEEGWEGDQRVETLDGQTSVTDSATIRLPNDATKVLERQVRYDRLMRPVAASTKVNGLSGRPSWIAVWRDSKEDEYDLLGPGSGVIESLRATSYLIRDGRAIALLQVTFAIESYEFLPDGAIAGLKESWLGVEVPVDFVVADQRAAFVTQIAPGVQETGASIWTYRLIALVITAAIIGMVVRWRVTRGSNT